MPDTPDLPADELAALKARVTELEAELRNVKMMVQGLGFAGVNFGVGVGGLPQPKFVNLLPVDRNHE